MYIFNKYITTYLVNPCKIECKKKSNYNLYMFTSELELKHIIAIAALYIIILVTISFTIRVVPYSNDNLFAIEFPYEGFVGLNPSTYQDQPVKPTTEPFSEIGQTNTKTQCQKIIGFNQLYCPPNYIPPLNDKFLGTPGGSSEGSYGLSNSMGGLKLTKEQKTLLNTRGGNSGGRSVIDN